VISLSFVLITQSRLTRRVASVAAIVLSFGGYVISSLSQFEKGLQPLARLLPYRYYDKVGLLAGVQGGDVIVNRHFRTGVGGPGVLSASVRNGIHDGRPGFRRDGPILNQGRRRRNSAGSSFTDRAGISWVNYLMTPVTANREPDRESD